MIALQSLIERAARLNPTGVATTYKGTNVTWADTEQRVAALASGLQHLGLSESDRKVLSMRLSVDQIYAPTAAFLYQFREVGILGKNTRVLHYDQPRFAWK